MQPYFFSYLRNLEEIHTDIRTVIKGLPLEALDWHPDADMNSIAVLIIHSLGAERYWIGDVVAGEPSGRDREAEFRVSGLTEAQLVGRMEEGEGYVRNALEKLTVQTLEEMRISARNGREETVGWALCHALKHTALHLGHMQLTRQIWQAQHPREEVEI